MTKDRVLKIILDISTLINHGQDIGAGRYILNLMQGLFSIDDRNKYILFGTYSDDQYLHLAYDMKVKFDDKDISFKLIKVNPGILKVYERLRFPPLELMGLNADVLHAMDYAIAPTFNNNIVLTIHDLTFMRFPESNFKWFIEKYSRMVRKNSDAASRILASSQSTASDIQKYFNIKKEKIDTVYLAAGPDFRKLAPNEIDCTVLDCKGISKPYILSVGTIEPRKDFITLIRSYCLARDKDPGLEHQLVIAGRTGWKSEAIYEARDKSKYTSDIIFTGRLTDRELIQLYNQADLFVYTSVFEGFGFPPLEAMSCGLPVICTDSSSITEVVGAAGILVKPGDSEGFAGSIMKTLKNKDLPGILRKKSLSRSKDFSWKQTAENTLSAYRKSVLRK
jgi:glycosyltransferase involved in cell wall biosynthesis